MSFLNWFKSTKAKAFALLGSFAMLLGVGASISVVRSAMTDEVVETKAEAVTNTVMRLYFYRNGWQVDDHRSHYPGEAFPHVGTAFGPAGQSTMSMSIAAYPAGYIPATSENVCSGFNGVKDLGISASGITGFDFTFFQDRWMNDDNPSRIVGWRNKQSDEDPRNAIGLDDDFSKKFLPGYIYSLTLNANNQKVIDWYKNDPFDGWDRKMMWVGYTISRVGVFVHFDVDGGELDSGRAVDEEHLIDQNFTLPTPTKTGYTFMGWKDESNGFVNRAGAAYGLTAPNTFTAVWQSNTHSVIAGDKTRIFLGYDGNADQVYYKGDASITIRLWDGEAAHYYSPTGTYYNTSESITGLTNCPRRYDYFDIETAYFNGTSVINVRRNSETQSSFWSNLTADHGLHVFYCPSSWGSASFSAIGSLASSDSLFATIALCGIHTCANNALNGYQAFTFYQSAFASTEAIVSGMSEYTIMDYANGDTDYDGSISNSVSAMAKHTAVSNMKSKGNPNGAMTIPGAPTGNESPLTLTLWIVLGCGIAGLGAISTAYFVSKRKKRPQA